MGQRNHELAGYVSGPNVDVKTGAFTPSFARFFTTILKKISHGIHDYDFEIIAGSITCTGSTISWSGVQITFGDKRYAITDDSTTSVWVYYDVDSPTEFQANATFPSMDISRVIVCKRTAPDTVYELWGEQWKILYLDLINTLFTGYADLYEIQGLGVSSSYLKFVAGSPDQLQLIVNSIINILVTSTYVNIATELRLQGNKVLGTRKTGWTVPSGTGSKSGYTVHAGQTISNPPTQAEVQAIDDHLVQLSKALKSLINDLHATAGHGLIGT